MIKKRGNHWWVVVYAGRDPLTGRKRQKTDHHALVRLATGPGSVLIGSSRQPPRAERNGSSRGDRV